MSISKQSVGIDIAKKTFTVCICTLFHDRTNSLSEVVQFDNNKTGFNKLMRWVRKKTEKSYPVFYFMEATGTYYESLAYYLTKLKKNVGVVLPNKVSHFAKSLNVKTKTDLEDSKMISRMGAEREFDLWTPPAKLFKDLRSLSRLYNCLQKDKVMTSNRLSALNSGHEPHKLSKDIYNNIINSLNKKLSKIEIEMTELLKSDTEVWSKVQNLITIPGIGMKTISIILGETQGFKLIRNQRQLTSFCGLDVTKKESGTSVNGKSKISKKGNSHIRAALYFPALSASRHNNNLIKVYDRINEKNTNKMKGIVALQRRLLVLMYSLWKSDMKYIEDYENVRKSDFQEDEETSLSSTHRVEKVDGAQRLTSTQNEHLHDQASEVLLCH